MANKDYEQKRNELWYEYTAMLRRNCASRYVFDKIFDRAYALGKQEKDAEDTVIQGWISRDKDNALILWESKPQRNNITNDEWGMASGIMLLPNNLFPDLTWDSDPLEVEIIIKRKKNG